MGVVNLSLPVPLVGLAGGVTLLLSVRGGLGGLGHLLILVSAI